MVPNTMIVMSITYIDLGDFNLLDLITPSKTNMDTHNDGLEHVFPFKKRAIFGMYLNIRGCSPIVMLKLPTYSLQYPISCILDVKYFRTSTLKICHIYR